MTQYLIGTHRKTVIINAAAGHNGGEVLTSKHDNRLVKIPPITA
jgi:hypothetical protein